MDTQNKSSSVTDNSKTSTESTKLKFKKRGRPSKADKEKALVALAKAAAKAEAKAAKKLEKENIKIAGKLAKAEAEVEAVPSKKPGRPKKVEAEKATGVQEVKEVKEPKAKGKQVVDSKALKADDEVIIKIDEYDRLKEIETTAKELFRNAAKANRWLGFGKNESAPDTSAAQEGPGVRTLRKLVGMEVE